MILLLLRARSSVQIFTIFIAVVESNVHEIELTNATYDIVTIIAVKYTYEHKAL